jgi:hypothetical protein
MDLLMQRDERRPALVAATELDEERLRSIRRRVPFQVQITFPRTGNLQRFYRGLVGRVADAIGASPDALHAEIKFKAGLVEQIILVRNASVGAGVAIRLQSTAYPTMDEPTFSRFVDTAIEIICRDYLHHVSSREREKLILEWVGHRPK